MVLHRRGHLTLYGCETDTSSSGMDEHVVTLLDARPHDKRAVARRRRDEQARRLLERPSIWHRKKGLLEGAELGRKGTLRGAKDAGSGRELGVGVVARGGDDGACKLGSSDPGEGFARVSTKGGWN